MEVFNSKWNFSKEKETLYSTQEILISQHGTFSTEDETFPTKILFSIQRRSFLTENGIFQLKIKLFHRKKSTLFHSKQILLSKHGTFSTEDETFPAKILFFPLKTDPFWVNMKLFNSKWNFSNKSTFFNSKEVLFNWTWRSSTQNETFLKKKVHFIPLKTDSFK